MLEPLPALRDVCSGEKFGLVKSENAVSFGGLFKAEEEEILIEFSQEDESDLESLLNASQLGLESLDLATDNKSTGLSALEINSVARFPQGLSSVVSKRQADEEVLGFKIKKSRLSGLDGISVSVILSLDEKLESTVI